MYNRITEVLPSDFSGDLSTVVSQSRYVLTQRSSPVEFLESSENLEPHVDDSPDESLSADLEVVSEVGMIVNIFPRASSPLCYRSFDCSLSTIKEGPGSPQPIDATECKGGTPLFHRNTVTVQQATALLDCSPGQALLPTDNCLHFGILWCKKARSIESDKARSDKLERQRVTSLKKLCIEIYNKFSIIRNLGEKTWNKI